MKNQLLFLTLLALVCFSSAAQNVTIPDPIFKSYLVNNSAINTNNDTEIQVSEARIYKGNIFIKNLSISDLTGIEALDSITGLNCAKNNLTSLDLSNNTQIKTLYCENNAITSLDLSNNTLLTRLFCYKNNLTALDVSQSPNIAFLACSNNKLTTLDVSAITKLDQLNCGHNSLDSLDLTKNLELVYLYCEYNSLATLDLSKNTKLDWLTCQFNKITSLDVSMNPKLYWFYCHNNLLNTLDIRFNPELTALHCYSNSLTDLNINNNNKLVQLFCNNNSISALNLYHKSDLKFLYCSYNNIKFLDARDCKNLFDLRCSFNPLASLNVVNNTALERLYFMSTNITGVNLSKNVALENVWCRNSKIQTLDLSNNPKILSLWSDSTPLTQLNFANGANTIIFPGNFNILNSPNLTCVQVDNPTYSATNWTKVDNIVTFSSDCSYPCTVNIPDSTLKAYLVGNSDINTNNDNEIQCKEASAYTGVIDCKNLVIADLTGLEKFILIEELHCQNNALKIIEIDKNTQLKKLSCGGNMISVLDLSKNTELTHFSCYSSSLLERLDFRNENNISILTFNTLNNPKLNCIKVDNPVYSKSNWIQVDDFLHFSLDCGTIPVYSIKVQGEDGVNTITVLNGNLQMEAIVVPANATNKTYTWSVANGTGSASIDSLGLLIALSNGTVTIKALANDGSGAFDSAVITISNQTSSISKIAFNDISIYPNPVTDILQISNIENVSSLRLLDLTGKVVQVYKPNKTQLNLCNIAKGVYALELSKEGQKAFFKIYKR